MANKQKMEVELKEIAVDKVVDNILDTEELELVKVPKQAIPIKQESNVVKMSESRNALINCLRNERVIVRHIDKPTGLVRDPKHVLYGGMAENATRTYTVPLLRSGLFFDVLTKDEKNYLEYALGLEPNALSIYNKDNNFWSTANPNGIATVTLRKQDNYLDLSVPTDYIKYKILLANKDRIAPSLEQLQDTPKATYEFVIITDTDSSKTARLNMSTKMQCYKEFGKYENDADVLRLVVETIEGRPLSVNTKLEFLQTRVNDIIQSNGKLFLKTINDKYLGVKVMIKKAINAGIIAKRGDYLYMREDNMPLCENDQEPTFSIAAAYLSNPKHQDLKFTIEAKLQQ